MIHRYLLDGSFDLFEKPVSRMTSSLPGTLQTRPEPPTAPAVATSRSMARDMEQVEKHEIWEALEANHWHIGNSARALPSRQIHYSKRW